MVERRRGGRLSDRGDGERSGYVRWDFINGAIGLLKAEAGPKRGIPGLSRTFLPGEMIRLQHGREDAYNEDLVCDEEREGEV